MTTTSEPIRIRNYIDGKWADEPGVKTIPLFNPSNGKVIGEVPLSTAEASKAAIASCHRAYDEWRRQPIGRRVKFLFDLRRAMERLRMAELRDGVWLRPDNLDPDRWPDARAVVLTGYGNIATAVTAVKLGAIDYLAKPADADDVHIALTRDPEIKAEPPENPMSADRVRWEHIQRIYELCGRNVSETARQLNMHRRTLQRILAKRAPR